MDEKESRKEAQWQGIICIMLYSGERLGLVAVAIFLRREEPFSSIRGASRTVCLVAVEEPFSGMERP